MNDQQDRALLLAALASVSLVTWFDEDTPVQLIERLRPDVYVKGGDYDMETLQETATVRSWGGHSVAIPLSAATPPAPWLRKYKAPQSRNSVVLHLRLAQR